jgi:ornithine decarboxylase
MFARRTFQQTRKVVQKSPRVFLTSSISAAAKTVPRVNQKQYFASDHFDSHREGLSPRQNPVLYSESRSDSPIPLSPLELIQSHVDAGATGSFLVTNLATIRAMHAQWLRELPMVRPFYAVKCNPDPAILRLLASLGCGFDCASQGEIDLVINKLGEKHNFSPAEATSSIIYAHPAKMEHMLRYALDQKVGMTVFDGEDELYKIASMEGFRDIKVLLRLTTDDKSSVCRFSNKFGCPVGEAPALMKVAKSLGINVVGCSFHVGSGCGDAQAYTTALEHCREVFIAADELGMQPLTVIDIGGGFPGDTGGYGGPDMPTFQDLAKTIREGISTFCDGGWTTRSLDDFQFMAEPGRYFASASTSIASKVYARKGGSSTTNQALYIDDGVYGSFNSVVYDHATPVPVKVSATNSGKAVKGLSAASDDLMPTAVFGPTCDGLDQVCSVDTTLLPRCEVGDWLVFDNCGAYTHTASFFFNGYTHVPTKLYSNYSK